MRITSALALAGVVLIASASAVAQDRPRVSPRVQPGVVVVKVKPSAGELMLASGATGISSLDARLSRWGATGIEKMFRHKPIPQNSGIPDISRILRIRIPAHLNPLAIARDLAQDPHLEYAEPVPIARLCALPNDPLYAQQHHLPQILAPSGWDVQTGDSAVIIAFVDTGTDYDHVDLQANAWVNQAEASGIQGVDDDGNGFVDDIHGWDFGDNDPDPMPQPSAMPDFAHGTHCTGIACAVTNNQMGIAGVSWNCRFMPLKAWSDDDASFGGYEAIVYAADNGAHVISNSWMTAGPTEWEQEAVTYAYMKGALVVCAAGNDGVEVPNPPAVYRHALSVAALSTNDAKTQYSTYGPWVDIAAPGGDEAGWILSTVPGNGYEGVGWAGTSMATPVVAGVCGLLRSRHPTWTNDQIVLQLLSTADNIDAVNPGFGGLLGHGRVNTYRALSEVAPTIADARLAMMSYGVDDSSFGDGDGVLERGESILLRFNVRNFSIGTTDAGATELTSSSPAIEVVEPTAGPLVFAADSELTVVHTIRIADTGAPGMHELEFTVRSGHGYSHNERLRLPVGKTPVLLVDYDFGYQSFLPEQDTFYRGALNRHGIQFLHWDFSTLGCPHLRTISQFPIVMGICPWGLLDEAEWAALGSYLDGGGSLFLGGQDVGSYLWEMIGTDSARSFLRNYLHAEFITGHSGSSTVEGILADPISHDLSFHIWQPGIPEEWQSPDVIRAEPGAEPIFTYHDGRTAGIRYEGEHRVIYTTFGLECVDADENTQIGSVSAIRDELLLRIVNWLNPLAHDPRKNVAREDTVLTLEATLRGGVFGFTSPTLFWRQAGETAYQSTPMTDLGQRRYHALVPAPGDDGSIEYYLETDHPYYPWKSPAEAPASFHTYPVPALIVVHAQEMDFGLLQGEADHRDSSFLVWNLGGSEDSISVSLDYVNVSPESAITVSPTVFVLPPDSTQAVRVRLRPNLLAPISYNAIVLVNSWRSSGPSQISVLVKFHVATTGTEEDGTLPRTYALYQNYPNPFNPSTTIEFDLPHSGFITLKVYNVLGEEVATLMEGNHAPGTFKATWNASEVPSGVYLYRLIAGSYVQTKKMLLIR